MIVATSQYPSMQTALVRGALGRCPRLTILVVGHVVVKIVLIFEQALQLAMGLTLAIWLPVIVLLTLVLLPRCKGVIAALMWAVKAERSEKT